jgi:hypothetical protein
MRVRAARLLSTRTRRLKLVTIWVKVAEEHRVWVTP